MIFVTTGSTKQSVYYLPLLEKLEQLKRDAIIDDEIIVQAGHIQFKSNFFKEVFDYTTEFEKYVHDAEIIITADGAGTVFDLLTKQKKIIVIANELASRYGAPAEDLIGGFAEEGYLVWCKNLNTLSDNIHTVKNKTFKQYKSPSNNIAASIITEFYKWK